MCLGVGGRGRARDEDRRGRARVAGVVACDDQDGEHGCGNCEHADGQQHAAAYAVGLFSLQGHLHAATVFSAD